MSNTPHVTVPDHSVGHAAGGPMAPPSSARLNCIAVIHGTAFLLQGLVLARLLGLDAGDQTGLLAAFTSAGVLLAIVWRSWVKMPHWLDMSVGMAGAGSLGMYFGTWIDHHFGPVSDLNAEFWMYALMLSACNLSMFSLMHHAHHHRFTDVGFLSMLIGGNAGMVVGMQLGKRVVYLFPAPPAPFQMLWGLLGMSFGMILGMLAGYATMLSVCRRLKASV